MFYGEEVRAIDFDDCGWGYYTYDRAVTLSYLEDWGTFPALQDTFLTGYQRVRPLPRRYGECLEVFLAARILAIVPWILRLGQGAAGTRRPAPASARRGRLDTHRVGAADWTLRSGGAQGPSPAHADRGGV